jgi:hypothetical protein
MDDKMPAVRFVGCLLLFVALACGTAFAKARFSSPSSAAVGDQVTAKASGLKPGRYALTLAAAEQPVRGAFCVKRLTRRHAASGGKLSLTGTIPKRVTCYQGNGAKLGSVKVRPGKYYLIVSVPNGPTGSSGKFSFVRHTLRITD